MEQLLRAHESKTFFWHRRRAVKPQMGPPFHPTDKHDRIGALPCDHYRVASVPIRARTRLAENITDAPLLSKTAVVWLASTQPQYAVLYEARLCCAAYC